MEKLFLYLCINSTEIFNTATAAKELENIKMKDSHLTDRYGINIVVIRRKDEYLSADKETIILEGDRITLFGPYSNIKHLFNNANK